MLMSHENLFCFGRSRLRPNFTSPSPFLSVVLSVLLVIHFLPFLSLFLPWKFRLRQGGQKGNLAHPFLRGFVLDDLG